MGLRRLRGHHHPRDPPDPPRLGPVDRRGAARTRRTPGRVAGRDRCPRRPGAGPRRRRARRGRRRCGAGRPRPLPAGADGPPAGPAARRGPAVPAGHRHGEPAVHGTRAPGDRRVEPAAVTADAAARVTACGPGRGTPAAETAS
ncbi:hypothetical protein SGPA1_10364 [Streptomyces misionensis JCM 4497]